MWGSRNTSGISLHRKEAGMERGSHLRGNLVSVQIVVPIFLKKIFFVKRESWACCMEKVWRGIFRWQLKSTADEANCHRKGEARRSRTLLMSVKRRNSISSDILERGHILKLLVAKKYVRIFPYNLTEKLKCTFWPAQYYFLPSIVLRITWDTC